MQSRPRLLLHACCAPCSTHVVEVLKKDYDLAVLFYNPNIQPEEEYLMRLGEMKRFAQKSNLKLLEQEYDSEAWFELTRGLENELEGGKRCELCYKMRLEKAAQVAKEQGFEYLATTLSISPHKSAKKINQIGEEIVSRHGLKFLSEDFKKKDGFKKSVQLSKELGLRRQSYCGCIYSQKERLKRTQRSAFL